MLLSVHVTSVLFLVWFNNFDRTMGFYWSYVLLGALWYCSDIVQNNSGKYPIVAFTKIQNKLYNYVYRVQYSYTLSSDVGNFYRISYTIKCSTTNCHQLIVREDRH